MLEMLTVQAAPAIVSAPVAWYNQPIFTTLLTLALGSLILNWLKERWAREEKRREKTLEFLESTGDRLNHLLSLVFGTLATGDLSAERLEELRSSRRPLFEKRFAVRLGAEAYLGSISFSKEYEFLIVQLYELVEVLGKIAGRSMEISILVSEVQDQRSKVAKRWPLDDESDDPVEGRIASPDDKLFIEVYRWARMIWRRSLRLVSLQLRRELGLSRKLLKRRPTPYEAPDRQGLDAP